MDGETAGIICIIGICGIAEFYMMYEHYSCCSEKRAFAKRRVVLLLALVYLGLSGMTQTTIIYPKYYIIIAVGSIFIRAVIFKGRLYECIRDSLMVMLCIIAVKEGFRHYYEFFRLKDMANDVYTGIYDIQYLHLLFTIGGNMLSYILLRWWRQLAYRRRRGEERKLFACYMIIPEASIINIICAPYAYSDEMRISATDFINLLIQMIIYAGSFVLLHLFDKYIETKEQEIVSREMSAKYMERERYYGEIGEINRKHAVMAHNMHHYLREIRKCAENGNTAEIKKIVDELQEEFTESREQQFCYYPLLNSILADYKARAEGMGIKTDIFVEAAFNVEYMTRIDLMGLLGNVLDNAVEAAERCEDGRIDIRMFLQNGGSYAVISVRNTYDGDIKRDGDTYRTTKESSGEHGVGMKNIDDIVYKYDGYVEREYDGQHFETVIVLPVKKLFV